MAQYQVTLSQSKLDSHLNFLKLEGMILRVSVEAQLPFHLTLFFILKLWIVSFERYDDGFETGAINLAGTDNIADCLLKTAFVLKDREFNIFGKFNITR